MTMAVRLVVSATLVAFGLWVWVDATFGDLPFGPAMARSVLGAWLWGTGVEQLYVLHRMRRTR